MTISSWYMQSILHFGKNLLFCLAFKWVLLVNQSIQDNAEVPHETLLSKLLKLNIFWWHLFIIVSWNLFYLVIAYSFQETTLDTAHQQIILSNLNATSHKIPMKVALRSYKANNNQQINHNLKYFPFPLSKSYIVIEIEHTSFRHYIDMILFFNSFNKSTKIRVSESAIQIDLVLCFIRQ